MDKLRIGVVLIGLLCGSSWGAGPIRLNDQEYFEAPGFSFLVFHNNYLEGYQGGLQLIQNGERLLDSGELFLVERGGNRVDLPAMRREVDRATSTATVIGELGHSGKGYRLVCSSDGARIRITARFDEPVDWTRYESAGFHLALYPAAYYSKSYVGETGHGVFSRQFSGQPILLSGTSSLRLAVEDSSRQLLIRRIDGGKLTLTDDRAQSFERWYSIEASIEPGLANPSVELEITPTLNASWRRPPVIGIPQSGYDPRAVKRAVLELDPREPDSSSVQLYRITLDGRKLVKSAEPQPWGRWLRYQYGIFDFTEVGEAGLYLLEYKGQEAGPFRIDTEVLADAWKPTLRYFLPIQMCHVAVREGVRTWHGACHLSDAVQAPAHTPHIDNYMQGERETRFDDKEHIPGLDWGGWHDAADNDLPAGGMANTTLLLALAQEEFSPELDETTLSRANREVLLHQPDGKSDLLQQVEFGVEGLLASFRVSGHIFPGVIESNEHDYGHLGDQVNVVDHRWAFTNRNTGLQYSVAQALAAASRVLRQINPNLASEALAAARSLWDYEQTHSPVYAPNAYVPLDSGFRSQEIAAAAELYLTTREPAYRDRLIELLPPLAHVSPAAVAAGPLWTLVRVLPDIPDHSFQSTVRRLASDWKTEADHRAASNPWGVHYGEEIRQAEWKLKIGTKTHRSLVWGSGWSLQADAVGQYFLQKNLPEMFDSAPLMATVNFVLGNHPGNNESYVSGVGARSALIANGFNSADWSYVPGGVISGASLIVPDFMELKEFPFLWYQSEYVVNGAASYIFDVLAAKHVLDCQGSAKRLP
jgi:endoglucanase